MHGKPPTAQEDGARSERVTIAVTVLERRAIRAVAAIRGVDESHLVRSMPISDIVAEFERVRTEAEGEPVAKVG
jgi:hypothetical protein